MEQKEEKTSASSTRPPIVVVLGHVDHGKTTLLDQIRESNVAGREHGAITQHIGAYQVEHKGKKITFIDTPGHAAFEEMRSHGAKVADIALLVVASDDGVKPQTVEAIRHINSAEIPFIVVISKVDLPQSDPEKVKKELAKENVLVEGYGGSIVCEEISAKEGKGISDLLEIISLVGDLAPLEADPNGEVEAVVIESQLDRAKGPLASVVVKNGILRVGQQVIVGNTKGKIRSLVNSQGERVEEATPSTPVQILGFSSPPAVGAVLREGINGSTVVVQQETSAISVLKAREEKKEKFKIIVKADVSGSLDAIFANLPDSVLVVYKGLGDVSENDLHLAQTTGSLIYGFNVRTEKTVETSADKDGIEIKIFKLIYELFESLEEDLKKFVDTKVEAEVKGRAKVIAFFDIAGTKIAGLKVLDGVLEKGKKVRVVRDNKVLGEVKVVSLKHHKKDIEKAEKGMECGASFDNDLDFKVNDSIEFLAL